MDKVSLGLLCPFGDPIQNSAANRGLTLKVLKRQRNSPDAEFVSLLADNEKKSLYAKHKSTAHG
jgi:hypothetical protein